MPNSVLFVHGAGEEAHEEDEPLATSLGDALGGGYAVSYPPMPASFEATYEDWIAAIEGALARLAGPVGLVGHSVGGSVLLKYLSEARVAQAVDGLFVLAAPFWGADDFWQWEEARLPADAAARLAQVPRIVLYHGTDDRVVPYSHLGLYRELLPDAAVRAIEGRGHQFGNDLAFAAADIRAERVSER